jgi:hypothetical protein
MSELAEVLSGAESRTEAALATSQRGLDAGGQSGRRERARSRSRSS